MFVTTVTSYKDPSIAPKGSPDGRISPRSFVAKRRQRQNLVILLLVALLIYLWWPPFSEFFLATYKTGEPRRHRRYCILYNFTKASGSFRDDEKEPISLAAHTSLEFLHYLYDQIDTWDGPISLSLYVERDLEEALTLISGIHGCFPKVSSKLSVHVFWERSALSASSSCPRVTYPVPDRNCKHYEKKEVTRLISQLERKLRYPINVARNVARLGASSSIHLVADVEMIFSVKFALRAKTIANKLLNGRRKNVLIVRRFESNESFPVPRTVRKLEAMLENGSALEFHSKFFAQGHTIPALRAWLDTSLNSSLVMARKTEYSGSKWEPQFIMHAKDPFHDEDVPTRHRDHQVLAYELCRANYRFYVLSHVFNVHRGIKTGASNIEKEVALLGQEKEKERAKAFSRRMDRMYPLTVDQCTDWDPRQARRRGKNQKIYEY